MRVLLPLAGVSLVGAKDGIDTIFKVLSDQLAAVREEGTKQASLYEAQTCSFKDAFDRFQEAIKENQGKFEEMEGKRQGARATWEFLNGDKDTSGSLANTKGLLLAEQSDLAEETATMKKNEKKALKELADAAEAITLVQKAKDTLAAATLDAENVHALVQLKTSLRSLNMAHLVDDPEKHMSNHSEIISMLDKLLTDIQQHKVNTDQEWKTLKDQHTQAINDMNAEIKRLKEKLAEDTKTMEENRELMLKMQKEMAALKLTIDADVAALKQSTERATAAKNEYDADQKTRTEELSALHSALTMMEKKFNEEAPVVEEPAKGEDGKPAEVACDFPDTAVVWPTIGAAQAPSFLQTSSAQVSISRHNGAFLQRRSSFLNDREDLIALLDTKAAKLKSSTLMALATSIRADPLKKVRIMIQNLIKRLQDEAENELKRHQDCDQKETALQDERASKKKEINDYESKLESAQNEIAETTESLEKLEQGIADLKQECMEQNSQYLFDKKLHENQVAVATHGAASLTEVLAEMDKFFGEANQASVESGYSGDSAGGEAIIGIMEGLKKGFEKMKADSTEETQKLSASIANLISDTTTDVTTKRDEQQQLSGGKLAPAIEGFKQSGADLHNSIISFAERTGELIELKYESACKDTQLSKAEEIENKKAEIEALKDALNILEAHGE
jgi:hypothetical protein